MSRFTNAVAVGALIGAIFGVWNLVATFAAPLADDSPAALAAFYGPMMLAWGFAGFAAFRRTGRLLEAIKVGAIVGLVTFAVLQVAAFIRVNVFLDVLRYRSDWQHLVASYEASGFSSLRT